MAYEDRGLLKLSNELLRMILDYIESDPDKLVNLDRRAYLSQESFKPPSFPSPDQAEDIGSFRLTCRRFSKLGAIHQYARVTTRFSHEGFRRLVRISKQKHLVGHVKKFSYMVPYFYDIRKDRQRELLRELRIGLPEVDPRHFSRKQDDQEAIVQQERDARALERAFGEFNNLAHIQILRVQDYEDSVLIRYLRANQNRSHFVEPVWARACFHSTKTIGAALLKSSSPCSRFSSPMLSTHSARDLAASPPQKLTALVRRLTSLELHFDDSLDLDRKMMSLSGLFQNVLTTAVNMQAIHVGFPSHYPLSLRLEDIFHGVRWDNLQAFGIQAWKLDAKEIINFARRHREKLRGLRLRDVLLKEQSMWKDVLQMFREEMVKLDWVSLRRIGYARHFEEQMNEVGIEIEDIPGGDSESGDEEEEFSGSTGEPDGRSDQQSDEDMADMTDDEEENEENGPHANEMGFPQLTEDARPWCNCSGQVPLSADELGDDGISVSNQQRKMWEKWCTRRCVHGEYHHVG